MRSEGDDTFKTGLLKTEYKKLEDQLQRNQWLQGEYRNRTSSCSRLIGPLGSSEVP